MIRKSISKTNVYVHVCDIKYCGEKLGELSIPMERALVLLRAGWLDRSSAREIL